MSAPGRRWAGAGLLLAALALGAGAHADQTHPRLDELFDRLQSTDDPQRAQRITARIWRLWRRFDDPEIAESMERGSRLLTTHRYDEAEAVYTRVIERAPDFAEAWNRRATTRYLAGDYAGAAADIRRTLVLEPRHFGALSGLGLVFMELEHYRAAIDAFQRALEINPHMEGTRRNIEIARERLRADSA